MALHDYLCDHCGRFFPDIDVSIAIGAAKGAPQCPECCRPTSWIPQVGRMDAREPFQQFSVMDGRNRPVVVDSLHKLRQIERESEQLARNGEGQQLVFRRWAQDRSNIQSHTLGDLRGPSETPDPAAARRFGRALRSAEAPDVTFGPGVSEANASALDTISRGSSTSSTGGGDGA